MKNAITIGQAARICGVNSADVRDTIPNAVFKTDTVVAPHLGEGKTRSLDNR